VSGKRVPQIVEGAVRKEQEPKIRYSYSLVGAGYNYAVFLEEAQFVVILHIAVITLTTTEDGVN